PETGTAQDDTVTATSITVELADASHAIGTEDDPAVAAYRVSYATKQRTGIEVDPNPLDAPPDISWGGSELTQVTQTDAEDDPIVNSAGDLYDPLPERPVRGGEVEISINTSTNPASWCTTYSYTTNNAEWYGVAQGNALIGKITASK